MRSKSHSWAKVGKGSNGAIRVIATLRLRGSARRAWKPDHHVLYELGPHSNEIDASGVLYMLRASCSAISTIHAKGIKGFQGCFTEGTRRAIREGQGTRLLWILQNLLTHSTTTDK